MSPDRGAIVGQARLPSLDGIRGIAITLVLMHNMDMPGIDGSLIDRLLDHGWVGVQLFFVLSGFLITGILLDSRGATNFFSGFYARRALRIFPLYYMTLIVVFVLLPAIGKLPAIFIHDFQHQGWFWFYLSNWHADNWEAFPHYWSLALEEQFYLLWPLVVYRTSPSVLFKICIGLALFSLGVRLAMRLDGVSADFVYVSSFARMDALELGGAAAASLRLHVLPDAPRTRCNWLLGAAVCAGVVGALVSDDFDRTSLLGQTLGYSGLSVSFSLLVLAAATADQAAIDIAWRTVLESRPLRVLGAYSYAIYVFHRPLHKLVGQPLIAALPAWASRSQLVALLYVLVGGLASLAVAMVSYRLVERPFLKLKDRFEPRRLPAAKSPPVFADS